QPQLLLAKRRWKNVDGLRHRLRDARRRGGVWQWRNDRAHFFRITAIPYRRLSMTVSSDCVEFRASDEGLDWTPRPTPFRFDLARELRNRRRGKEAANGNRRGESRLDSGERLYREQRIPAELEEIAVHADSID